MMVIFTERTSSPSQIHYMRLNFSLLLLSFSSSPEPRLEHILRWDARFVPATFSFEQSLTFYFVIARRRQGYASAKVEALPDRTRSFRAASGVASMIYYYW